MMVTCITVISGKVAYIFHSLFFGFLPAQMWPPCDASCKCSIFRHRVEIQIAGERDSKAQVHVNHSDFLKFWWYGKTQFSFLLNSGSLALSAQFQAHKLEIVFCRYSVEAWFCSFILYLFHRYLLTLPFMRQALRWLLVRKEQISQSPDTKSLCSSGGGTDKEEETSI